jgi:hypothetical protein
LAAPFELTTSSTNLSRQAGSLSNLDTHITGMTCHRFQCPKNLPGWLPNS